MIVQLSRKKNLEIRKKMRKTETMIIFRVNSTPEQK